MAATFHLQIVTPEGLKLDDQVESILVRTAEGDVGILKGHAGYVSAIIAGRIKVKQNGTARYGAASEGFIKVGKEITTLVATTFEWAEEIDVQRANASMQKAKELLETKGDQESVNLAKLRQGRAKVRLSVAGLSQSK